MKYLLAIIVLLSACSPSAHDRAIVEKSSEPEKMDPQTEIENSIFGDVPELAECKQLLLSQESTLVGEPTRTTSRYANIVEVPCGPAPGTGAYGYPMSLVVEWEAVANSPEGALPRFYDPVVFHERDKNGSFVPVGYVTQAISFWNEEDLSNGYMHLLYKYAGAGQCGMLTTYSSEAWRTPFEFREARERLCEAPPCEDDSCHDPKKWELIYSVWDEESH